MVSYMSHTVDLALLILIGGYHKAVYVVFQSIPDSHLISMYLLFCFRQAQTRLATTRRIPEILHSNLFGVHTIMHACSHME